MIEMDGFSSVSNDALMDGIKHFKEGGFFGDILGIVSFDAALGLGPVLTPNLESQIHGKLGELEGSAPQTALSKR